MTTSSLQPHRQPISDDRHLEAARKLRTERRLLHRIAMLRCSAEADAQWARAIERVLRANGGDDA